MMGLKPRKWIWMNNCYYKWINAKGERSHGRGARCKGAGSPHWPGVEVGGGGGGVLNQEPEKGRPRNFRSGRQVVLLWEAPWQGVPCQTRG